VSDSEVSDLEVSEIEVSETGVSETGVRETGVRETGMKRSRVRTAQGLGALLLLLGVTVWLASSVGPDTAPSDVKTIELDIDAR